jgi:hypothetical protein
MTLRISVWRITMKVKCINNDCVEHFLTLGKVYDVNHVNEDDHTYDIYDNNGMLVRFDPDRFDIIDEKPEKPDNDINWYVTKLATLVGIRISKSDEQYVINTSYTNLTHVCSRDINLLVALDDFYEQVVSAIQDEIDNWNAKIDRITDERNSYIDLLNLLQKGS